MGYKGRWFHERRCLVAVALLGYSNKNRLRLSLMNSILVSRFLKSKQGPPYL